MQVALTTKIDSNTYVWLEQRSKSTGIPKTQIVDAALQFYKTYLEKIQATPNPGPPSEYEEE